MKRSSRRKATVTSLTSRTEGSTLSVPFPRPRNTSSRSKPLAPLNVNFFRAITTFENIKGDLNLVKYKGVTAESLLAQIDNSEDKIKSHLKKQAGLV